MGKQTRKDFRSALEEVLHKHGINKFLVAFSKPGLTIGDGGEMKLNCFLHKDADFVWVNKAIRHFKDGLNAEIDITAQMDLDKVISKFNIKRFIIAFSKPNLDIELAAPLRINCFLHKDCEAVWVNHALLFVAKVMAAKLGIQHAAIKSKGGVLMPSHGTVQ